MTQENKNLLLKDISARLPYGVIVETPKGKGHVCDINLTIFGIEIGVNINPTIRDTFDIEDIQPYLYPLSSMTEEQMEELKGLCNMYIPERFNYDDYHPYAYRGIKVLYKHVDYNYKFDFKMDVIDWFNKNHFDYRGLIPKGLAIDATGLHIY